MPVERATVESIEDLTLTLTASAAVASADGRGGYNGIEAAV